MQEVVKKSQKEIFMQGKQLGHLASWEQALITYAMPSLQVLISMKQPALVANPSLNTPTVRNKKTMYLKTS